MPPTSFHLGNPGLTIFRQKVSVALVVMAVLAWLPVNAIAEEPPGAPTPVRSRSIELHYRVMDAPEGTGVELWYTRDRGATWQHAGIDEDGRSPFIFTAPAEGLYGFTLALVNPGKPANNAASPAQAGSNLPALQAVAEGSNAQAKTNAPAPHTPPQRWVFIDYNPPLLQWDSVEAGEDFANRRIVHLRWTAYDANFTSRPVSLAYQSSIEGVWEPIESAMANTGRYDWTVPPNLAGQISLKLAVTDMGGHAIERIYGPVPIENWLGRTTSAGPSTRPAGEVATRPAGVSPLPVTGGGLPEPIDLEKRLKAQELHRQGAWHLQSGRYAVAAERFREALEVDPDLFAAQCDLAGIYYLQQDYNKALDLYNAILARDANNLPAMRGAALAHVALKQYPQSRDMLRKVLAARGNDAQVWLDLGDVLFMMGDTVGAREHWAQASRVDETAETVIRKAKRRMELYGNSGEASAAVSP